MLKVMKCLNDIIDGAGCWITAIGTWFEARGYEIAYRIADVNVFVGCLMKLTTILIGLVVILLVIAIAISTLPVGISISILKAISHAVKKKALE